MLDGCRFDLFNELADIQGSTESRVSPASSTPEFIRTCLDGQELHDTIYVTANPQIDRIGADVSFHDIVRVWKTEGWDENEGTVFPATMTDSILTAANRYPNKRILGHYMQPHYPFIGSNAKLSKGHLQEGGGDLNVWQKRMAGKLSISDDELWSLYSDNLQIALPHVERALKELEGKTVISADHGNAFGERGTPVPIRTWGHPTGQDIPELVLVPWHIHLNGDRRSVVNGDPKKDTGEEDDHVVNDRLRDLGYLE